MDALSIGIQSIEAALHTGSTIVSAVDQLANAVVPMAAPNENDVSCEVCRCDF